MEYIGYTLVYFAGVMSGVWLMAWLTASGRIIMKRLD